MSYLKKELYTLVKSDSEIFDFIQQSALDGMWYWDLLEPENEWMNETFWRTFGIDPSTKEHKASEWQDLIHPDDLKTAFENFTKHCEDPKHPYDQEVRYKHADGSTVWIHCRGLAIRDDRGKPIRMIGAHTDITKRKKVELELREKVNQYELVVEAGQIATWELNVNTHHFNSNDIWTKILGIKSEELEAHKDNPLFLSIHPQDKEMALNKYKSYLKNPEGNYRSEFRLKNSSGKWIWVQDLGRLIQPLKGESPEIMVGSRRDITQSKEEKENLQKAFELNRLFVEQAPTAIAMFNKNMEYIAASRRWYIDYNIEQDSVIGMSHYEVFPEIGEEWKKHHQQCLQGHIQKTDEEKFVRDDGSIQWLSYEVRPWYEATNSIGGIIMYTADITSIKSSEDQIQSLLEVATSQNKRLLNFAHIVSHNLRSHTGNLKMLSELMKEEYPKLVNNEFFPLIEKAVGNLSETVLNLHEVAVINQSSESQLVKVNILDYIHGAIENVKASQIKEEAEINIDIDPKATILAVPAYLESIFLNLLTNALKYRSQKRKPKIDISLIENGKYSEIKFSDNGMGINLKMNGSKLFGMYKTFHKHKDSRGIGLFITKNQVEAMSGTISCKSKVDEGTVFTLKLKNEIN